MISIAMLFCFLEQNFTEKGQSAAELAPKNDVYNGNRPPSWILFFLHLIMSVTNLHLHPKFYQNRKIFRWGMTISRFSTWRISAMLNYRGPIMGYLKSSCGTSYRSSIAVNCLAFWAKNRVFRVRILATDRQTDKQTDKQMNRTNA